MRTGIGGPDLSITVGLGFDAVAVHLGNAQTEAPVVSPCGDAGLDAPSQ